MMSLHVEGIVLADGFPIRHYLVTGETAIGVVIPNDVITWLTKQFQISEMILFVS